MIAYFVNKMLFLFLTNILIIVNDPLMNHSPPSNTPLSSPVIISNKREVGSFNLLFFVVYPHWHVFLYYGSLKVFSASLNLISLYVLETWICGLTSLLMLSYLRNRVVWALKFMLDDFVITAAHGYKWCKSSIFCFHSYDI